MPSHNFNELTDAIHLLSIYYFTCLSSGCAVALSMYAGVRSPTIEIRVYLSSVERDEITKP